MEKTNFGKDNLVSKTVLKSLPIMVQDELNKLDLYQQHAFLDEYNRRKKTKIFAYVLWFLLGWHYGYVGKWGVQLLYLVTWWSFFCSFNTYGFLFLFMFICVFVWCIVDLFRIPTIINTYNKNLSIDILKELRAISR